MTTVCWDGSTLATDSRVTNGSYLVSDNYQKLYILEKEVIYSGDKLIAIGLGGTVSHVDGYLAYLYSGEFPCKVSDYDVTGIVVGEQYVYQLEGEEGFLIKYPRYEKLVSGSGARFALSAMCFGRGAVAAIKHAKKLDLGTGGPVQSVSL